MSERARSRAQRIDDALARLANDVDAWVASASGGEPHLVPLSHLWDGHTLLFATATSSPTVRNLQASPQVRVALGLTRDVVLLEGTVEFSSADEISQDTGDAFAAKAGFDPRRLRTPYSYLRVTPVRVKAWREEDELDGRDLMRGGVWLS